ncbi:MAG: choice-of-anchor tandem repeat GloVer-containing protein [Chthoniobacteraceae bacterium]
MRLLPTILLLALAGAWPIPSRAVDTILHSFTTIEGAPAIFGSLMLGEGVLFGMTGNGGDAFVGSIFRVNTDGSGFAVIHHFSNDGLCSDGVSPLSSLTLVDSVLYGMTPMGGVVPPVGPPANGGTVFRINTDGTGFQVLHGFTGTQLVGSDDGGAPYGAVTVSGATIYGMTRFGGSSARGTVFSLNTDGSGFQLLHSFAGGANDGAEPQGSLTLVGSKLYGLTNAGGINNEGTVFSINTDGSEFAVLHSFAAFGSGEGAEPIGGNGLTLVGTTLYGMTFNDGIELNGSIFSINLDGSEFRPVRSLMPGEGSGPFGSLTLSGLQLYGTTNGYGGNTVSNGIGSVFCLSVDEPAFTVIHTFAGAQGDGMIPVGDPVISPDGSNLYGMTQYGGIHNTGTIFSAPASGSLTNANLLGIATSAGALSSNFNSRTTRYTVYVLDATAAISVTATPMATGTSLTMNGIPVDPGVPSPPFNLSTGANVIDTIVTARDGVTTNIYTLTVIRLTQLQSWRLSFFGSSTNVGAAADGADSYGSGIPNLLRYAFGLAPTSHAAHLIPRPALSAGYFGVTFTEPPGVSGVLFGAEWTQTLNPPTWVPLPDSRFGSIHDFRVFVGNRPSGFMRLKVTVPLSPIEQLGRDIFFDPTLSDPPGVSCASCHSPDTGFTGPSSAINLATGPMPGAVAGRVGSRKPQAIAYSIFSPSGPYFDNGQGLWAGGNFWDGRAATNADQARTPFIGPNEMANIAIGPYPPHAGGYSPLVAQKLRQRPYAALFNQVFGAGIFEAGYEAAVYGLAAQAIAAYEASEDVNPFSSKFDASENAVPPANAYQFTPSEQNGMDLFFGKAQCSACHSSGPLDSVSSVTAGREVFTMYCYASIGTPKNPDNPFYQQQDPTNNPNGYNPLGVYFIDYGLGANPIPAPSGVLFMSNSPGDIADFRGLFKAPSLRNVDKRPSPDFVKSYMHNGVFKSLEEVVHFYNKRNIAVDGAGREVAFDLRIGPPPGYTRLFPPPEVLDNVQNAAGFTPSQTRQGEANVATNGQVGHLELTPEEETDLVNFLKALTDGFPDSNPVSAQQP